MENFKNLNGWKIIIVFELMENCKNSNKWKSVNFLTMKKKYLKNWKLKNIWIKKKNTYKNIGLNFLIKIKK